MLQPLGRHCSGMQGKHYSFHINTAKFILLNIINLDFNPLPSPLSSTLPRGLSHSLAQWELLTMRDNSL